MAHIYLDHAALTPCEPDAAAAVAEVLIELPAHPSSAHAPARRLRARIERARAEVATYLGCEPRELRFHASGTEALGAAIRHFLALGSGPVASLGTEHSAVQQALSTHRERVVSLQARGGDIDLALAERVLATAEVVVLSALNHELGIAPALTQLLPMAPRAYWVIDAIQAAAWLDMTPCFRDNVALAVASQKLGGPPGAAALRVPAALLDMPARTDESGANAPSVVGFGAACAVRTGKRETALARAGALGRRLREGLLAARAGSVRNGDGAWLGPILSVAWPDLSGREVEHILDLEDVAIARMSACRQRLDEASAVVQAAYPEQPWRARGATRWSLGWSTRKDEIDEAVARFRKRFGRTEADQA